MVMRDEQHIKAITLRNLPYPLAKRIREKSQRDGSSLNMTVIRMLEESTGLRRTKSEKPIYDDLDDVIGAWSAEEAAEFDEILNQIRSIDEDMWR